jgi:hypothetical protein
LYVIKEEAASPTAMTESILLTATIEAKVNRDVMAVDIPNAFIQTDMDSDTRGHYEDQRTTSRHVSRTGPRNVQELREN